MRYMQHNANMSNPKLTAKLFIVTENKQRIMLKAYAEALKAIAQMQKSDVMCEDLFAPSLDVTYNIYCVIINVARN